MHALSNNVVTYCI